METIVDINTLTDLAVTAVFLLPIVTGLVQVIKKSVNLDNRYVPILSVVLGVIAGIFTIEQNVYGVLIGVMIGLAGTGLYEFGKTTIANNS